jgi:chemotaxis protein methyltransferase CheR
MMPGTSFDSTDLTRADFAALAALVREHTGIAMHEHKRVLLQGRLRPRLRTLGLARYGDYIARVRADRAEVQAFINLVTTNDTAFFRTPAVWDYLERDFLPAWVAQSPGRTLRIWSAAAASGEEAYSLAMLCSGFQARAPQLNASQLKFAITATDIDTAVLATAATGLYEGRTAQRFAETHPELARSHFMPEAGGLRARPELRAHVRFGEHHLLAPWPGGAQFDLVLLRNVLIYFDEDNQKRVLGQVRAAMAPGARLVLGEQESITRIATPFDFEQTHVYRIRQEHA